ncbi:hypothetical protein [Leeia sp.]|uniref:hypothetical protein n=1 Tax=Leeia sp. TaxID=2884678 RepID=UPI0035B33A75
MDDTPQPTTLIVCTKHRFLGQQPSCGGRGSKALLDALKPLAAAADIEVIPFPCLGECEHGPNIKLAPGGRFFHQVTMAQLPDIVAAAQAWHVSQATEHDE